MPAAMRSPAHPDGLFGQLTGWRNKQAWIAHIPVAVARPAVAQARLALKAHEAAVQARSARLNQESAVWARWMSEHRGRKGRGKLEVHLSVRVDVVPRTKRPRATPRVAGAAMGCADRWTMHNGSPTTNSNRCESVQPTVIWMMSCRASKVEVSGTPTRRQSVGSISRSSILTRAMGSIMRGQGGP